MRGLALISVALCSLTAFAADDAKLPKLLATEPPKPTATDSELVKLQKERFAEVWKELSTYHKFVQAGSIEGGQGGVNSVIGTATRFLESYMALETKPAEKIELLTNYVEYVKEIESYYTKRFEAGALRSTEMNRVTWYRLDAEIKLLKAKEMK